MGVIKNANDDNRSGHQSAASSSAIHTQIVIVGAASASAIEASKAFRTNPARPGRKGRAGSLFVFTGRHCSTQSNNNH
jgi:hypothetical protein